MSNTRKASALQSKHSLPSIIKLPLSWTLAPVQDCWYEKASLVYFRPNARECSFSCCGMQAMFAIRHGASHVYACEMWDTMASIAVKTCETAYAGQITVLAKKSVDIIVGENGDMPTKADLLVSEIFDSALRKPVCSMTFSSVDFSENRMFMYAVVCPSRRGCNPLTHACI